MSRVNIKRKLRRLIHCRNKVLEQLLQSSPMLKGTVSRVQTRCGKPNCWCAESSRAHSHTRISWRQDGTPTTRKVPLAQVAHILKLTDDYRIFRSLQRDLQALDRDSYKLLKAYEVLTDHKARNAFDFLRVSPKNAAQTDKGLQKSQRLRKRTQ